MATLEIHDGRGRVEYVVISRESTALIGSDPKCDVVVDDPDCLPIHGRIRWKRGKFRVESTSGAHPLVVNGHRMEKSSLNQGDEVEIGRHRIFLINEGDAGAEADRTRIQEKPAVAARLEAGDWLQDIEVAPPSMEEPVAAAPAPSPPVARRAGRERPAPTKSAGTWGSIRSALKSVEPQQTTPANLDRPKSSVTSRVSRLWVGTEQAPGQERILTSPLVLGLGVVLVVLALLSYFLYGIIVRQAADGAFRRATDYLVEGDYRNAILAFDRFLELAPGDGRASEARVRRSLAGVQRFLTGGEQAWTQALDAASAMHLDSQDEPGFDEVRAEMAGVVVTIAQGLADRTRRTADRADLARIEESIALHDSLAGGKAAAARERARLPERIAAASAAVRKAETRAAALAEMDRAVAAGSAREIYQQYDALVGEYPDLAQDSAVVERMTRANTFLREAVTLDPSTRPALTEPRPEPFGPLTSLVVRSRPRSAAREVPRADVPPVFALVDGIAYGLASSDGSALWQRPVGLSSPFPPVSAGGRGGAVLVLDARSDELVRLDSATGKLAWRQPLGERVTAPPLVQGSQIVQVTPSGKIFWFDLESGALRQTLDLHVPIGHTPLADELGRYLYVLAERSALYIVSRDPPGCVAVEYLGHDSGAIPCPPVRVGAYLVVAENHRLDSSRWRVFLLVDEGKQLRPLQRLDVPGWTWDAPASRGSAIWALGDRGGLTAYAVGGGSEATSLRKIAGVPPDTEGTGPAYTWARTERELWLAANRLARYDLNPERGELQAGKTIVDVGPARAPIQVANRTVVFTQQSPDGLGVELIGVGTPEGDVAWRTTLGAPWPVAPIADAAGDGLVTMGLDGRSLAIPRNTLDSGGFVDLARPPSGSFDLGHKPLIRLVHGDVSVMIPSEGASEILVAEGDGRARVVALPTELACEPRFWGEDLVVPGRDGLVYLVDPLTGASKADPYVPPYLADRPYRWLVPAPIDGDAIVLADREGRVLRLDLADGERSRLVLAIDEVELGSAPIADPAASSDAVVIATADGRVRVLAATDLSPQGAWLLDARTVVGPVTLGVDLLVADSAGQVMMFGPDGQRRWSTTFADGPPVSTPALLGDDAWFLDRSGGLLRVSAIDGARTDRIPMEILPAGGPIALVDTLALPVSAGSIALRPPTPVLDASTLSEPADHAGR